MGLSNNKPEPKPIVPERDSVVLKPSPPLGTLYKELFIHIFEMLDTESIVAVIITCRYFQLINKCVSKSFMDIYCIKPLRVDNVREKFFANFKYPLGYVIPKLNLVVEPWVKFKQVVQGSKTKISSGCSTKALFWIQENDVKNNTSQLLQQFVSECPQTRILFLKGSPALFEYVQLPDEFKLSLEYLFINCDHLSEDWPQFFEQFPKLKCVYFGLDGRGWMTTTWTVNTQKPLLFIMDNTILKKESGNIK
jgi:hypothetical protein